MNILLLFFLIYDEKVVSCLKNSQFWNVFFSSSFASVIQYVYKLCH